MSDLAPSLTLLASLGVGYQAGQRGARVYSGVGAPPVALNGAPPGSLYLRQDAAAGATVYEKQGPLGTDWVSLIGGVPTLGAYGEIFHTGPTTPTLNGIGAAPIKYTGFTSNGVSLNTTPDQANNEIVVANAGIYTVDFMTQGQYVTINVYTWEIYVNGVASGKQGGTQTRHATTSRPVNITTLLSLSAGDAVEVYVNDLGGSHTFFTYSTQLRVMRIA